MKKKKKGKNIQNFLWNKLKIFFKTYKHCLKLIEGLNIRISGIKKKYMYNTATKEKPENLKMRKK